MSSSDHWKHKTQLYPLKREDVKAIAVFDDEKPGHVTLYQTDGKRFVPGRDVAISPIENFNKTLKAWSSEIPLLDLRNDKYIPLPVQAAAATNTIAIPHDLLERLMQGTAQALNLSDDHMRHSRKAWSDALDAGKELLNANEPFKEAATETMGAARPRMRV